ncbi:hypothetical protein LCGC14_2294770 [marine sediment metagenome]|uniref:Uncharacterized protein n=1 Tax=marine sediment metagenome TaxID=412755 RepID=A0A0F9FKB3_9ZZZZ
MVNEEIIIFPAKPQKQGHYYKIAIPPDLIAEGIIDPNALYEIRLRRLEKNKEVKDES